MIFLRWSAFVSLVLATGVVCFAQEKFPLKPGEWEVSTMLEGASQPLALRVCFNDEEWTRALTQSSACNIQDLKVSSKGVQYSMDCPSAIYAMKGRVELTFDGKEHMTGRGYIDATTNGKTTNSTTMVDYRWKAPVCSPNDVNLKQKPAK